MLTLLLTTTACQESTPQPSTWRAAPSANASSPADAPAASPSSSPSPSLPPDSAIPKKGAGTFATAPGTGRVIGSGRKLVRYRVELETGIDWGDLPKWTPTSFGNTVDEILAAPQGWTWSAKHPVTNAKVHLTKATWSFQRVRSNNYDVRIRLATPTTVNKACGAAGLTTEGVYSCKFGKTIMINLRRWLRGAPDYPVSLDDYHTGVINHEMGHFLGFNHMSCPGAGQPGPVMQTQTIDLGGCVPNVHPFAASGRFITGPWRPS